MSTGYRLLRGLRVAGSVAILFPVFCLSAKAQQSCNLSTLSAAPFTVYFQTVATFNDVETSSTSSYTYNATYQAEGSATLVYQGGGVSGPAYFQGPAVGTANVSITETDNYIEYIEGPDGVQIPYPLYDDYTETGNAPLNQANGSLYFVIDPSNCAVAASVGYILPGTMTSVGNDTAGNVTTSTQSVSIDSSYNETSSCGGYPGFEGFATVSAGKISYTTKCAISGYAGANYVTFIVSTSPIAPAQVAMLDPTSMAAFTPDGGLPNSPSELATGGNAVMGAAADGVAQVLIRIPGSSGNVQLTLLNGQGMTSNVPLNDGYLTSLDGTQSTKTTNPISIQVDPGTSLAFAVYHAPIDFARPPTNKVDPNTSPDAKVLTRNVAVQIQAGALTQTQQIVIARPPVLLIHGLWSSRDTWGDFYSGLYSALPEIGSYRVDYSNFAGASVDSNTPFALVQAVSLLTDFKTKNQVSAAQFDFIVHSMGGLISNNMPRIPLFRSRQSYGQGYIHKLITIDTPYEGSPFATGLQNSSATCKLIFDQMGKPIDGAIRDLVPNSDLLASLNPLPDIYPKHAIAGELTAAQSFTASLTVSAIFGGLGVLAPCYGVFVTSQTSPPLFSFDAYFGGSPDTFGGANDLIVSETSSRGEFVTKSYWDPDPGFAHFHVAIPYVNLAAFPSVLDKASGNPKLAVTLLNASVSGGLFLY